MDAAKNNKPDLFFAPPLKNELDEILIHPLTVVEAPMGYGKTTAVREYLLAGDIDLLWQNIYSDLHSDFWTSFCTLFKDIDETCATSLQSLGFPDNNITYHKMIDILSAVDFPRPAVVVLDDYHLADTPEIATIISFIVTNEIIDLHIVIIARYFANFNFEELFIKGFLHHIHKDSFALDPDGIVEYYGMHHLSITQEQATELHSITEGWISALYLLMLNYQRTGNIVVFFDIYRLMDEVIYQPLDEETKNFLMTMAVFDNFSRQMAGFIINDSELLLDEIIRKNAFIWFDPFENSYHIHNLLATFLRSRRNTMPEEHFYPSYKTAAEWYVMQNDYIHAMRFSHMCGDFKTLYRILEWDSGETLNREHISDLIKYYTDCPYEIKEQYPYGVLTIARYVNVLNYHEMFNEICGDLLNIIPKYKSDDETLYNNLLGEYQILQSFMTFNDIDKMGPHLQRASELLTGPSKTLNKRQPYTFGSPSILYLYYNRSGKLAETTKKLEHYLQFHTKISESQCLGVYEVMEGERLYYSGDFENSEIYMHRVYHLSPRKESGVLLCNLILNIKLHISKGDLESAVRLFEKARNIYASGNLVFRQTIDVYEAYFYAIMGGIEKIPLWIVRGDFEQTSLYFPTLGYLNVIYGKVLIEKGEYLKYLGIADSLLAMVSKFPNVLGQINIYIHIAAANMNINREDEAYAAMEKALDLALPDEIYMSFVENGSSIMPLLQGMHRRPEYKKGVGRILHLCDITDVPRQLKKSSSTSQDSLLSQREEEVALLAAQGISNKEIGKRLFISQNTVKTQLKNIYSKLGINSRTLLVYALGLDEN